MDEKKTENPLDSLKGVVGDLWGATMRLSQENAASLDKLTRELQGSSAEVTPEVPMPELTEKPQPVRPAQPAARPQPVKAAPAEPAFPPFETLWMTADESVDWTDAMAYAHPNDGLTSEHLWQFFHEHAERVLDGDLTAYLEVLRTANPLGDLRPYARSFSVNAVDADTLTVSFEALPGYMSKEPTEVRRYLAGVSLRCARDLMALLPVCEVRAEARCGGRTVLTVPFTRTELQKVRFGFVDPELFVIRCGGHFD